MSGAAELTPSPNEREPGGSCLPCRSWIGFGPLSVLLFGTLAGATSCQQHWAHPQARGAPLPAQASAANPNSSSLGPPLPAATGPSAAGDASTLPSATAGESQQGAENEPSPRGSTLLDASWSDLPLPGFEPALLWYRHRAPLLVVTHGAGGFAEWHCQHFHRMLNGEVTLLCPRGKPRFTRDPTQGFYYPDHLALRREVLAAVERFETVVSTDGPGRPYAYAGYSQGASMGALAFAEAGALFARLLLVEGGYNDWYDALVTRFKRSGGKAVVVICGTKNCHEHARAAAARFERAAIAFRSATAHGAGHRPDGDVETRTLSNLAFLFEGDPRWAGVLSNLRP